VLLQHPDVGGRLADLTGGSFSLMHQQNRLACRIEGLKYCGQGSRTHGSNDSQIEAVGVQILANVATHQGEGGRTFLTTPTIHDSAGELRVIGND
jgi:hypothetical protein